MAIDISWGEIVFRFSPLKLVGVRDYTTQANAHIGHDKSARNKAKALRRARRKAGKR